MSNEIPIETVTALNRLVHETLNKHGKSLGKLLAYTRDFALKYYYAHKKGLDDYKQDLKDAYAEWGIPMEILDEVAEKIEKRYTRREQPG
jgi:hypothetical protein